MTNEIFTGQHSESSTESTDMEGGEGDVWPFGCG